MKTFPKADCLDWLEKIDFVAGGIPALAAPIQELRTQIDAADFATPENTEAIRVHRTALLDSGAAFPGAGEKKEFRLPRTTADAVRGKLESYQPGALNMWSVEDGFYAVPIHLVPAEIATGFAPDEPFFALQRAGAQFEVINARFEEAAGQMAKAPAMLEMIVAKEAEIRAKLMEIIEEERAGSAALAAENSELVRQLRDRPE